MDYKNALEYLGKIDEYRGMNLSLANPTGIIRHFSFQLNHIHFIQVAGTNGKGSTAHFLASILQASGYKVGLFTSPHLHDIRERIKVNNQEISETDFAACICEIKKLSEYLLQKGIIKETPTYFEYTFLVSLYYFYQEKVDVVILEAGLGGRLDATSVITPILSVITGISHDHTAILGQHIKDIALEKAGIIKKNVPIVCGCNVHSIAHAIIKKKASELNAPFYNAIDSHNRLAVTELDLGYRCHYIVENIVEKIARKNAGSCHYSFDVHMNGRHQTQNAAAAVKTIQILETMGIAITSKAIQEGIKNTHVPARIEIIETQMQTSSNVKPGKMTVILDVSHNVESIKRLSDFLKQKKKQRLTLIFGVLADKNYRQMAKILLPFVEKVIITEPISQRALPAEKLASLFHKWGLNNVLVHRDIKKALEAAQKWQADILVTGSFYLVGGLRHMIINGG